MAVLGAGAAQRLFQYLDPMGQSVPIWERTSIGWSASWRGQTSGTSAPGAVGQQDLNDDIFIPLSCVQYRFGDLQSISGAGSMSVEKTELNEITMRVADARYVSQTAGMVRKILKNSHPNGDDLRLVIPLELLERAEEEKRIWNIVLGSIAGISLVVGWDWDHEYHAGQCHRTNS